MKTKIKLSRVRGTKRVMVLFLLVLLTFCLVPFAGQPKTYAATGINSQLNFQGRLSDNTGAIVADGSYNMEFKIYQDGAGCIAGGTSPCGGTIKWSEDWIQTNRITVKNGYFAANLNAICASWTGACSSNGGVDWNQDTLWLSINIGGVTNTPTPTWDGEMTPFKRLTSTPYSLNSNALQGLQAASFVQIAQGVQTDTSISNPSIFINKNNASLTPNIFELQKSSVDVLVVNNTGGVAFTPGSTSNVVVNADNDSNLQVISTISSDVSQSAQSITITDNASASTAALYGLSVVNADNGANVGVPDALAYLKNANAADTVGDGLLVEQTGAGTLTNGIEIKQSAGAITNGLTFSGTFATSTLKVGSNTILNATGVLQSAGLSGTYSNGLTLSGTTNSYNGNSLNIAATAVPVADIATISNTGQGVTGAGINGLQITYVGGAAAVESGAQRIDLTGGTTAAGIWNGLRVVQGTITSGTTVRDIKLETASLSTTSGTTVISGLSLPTAGAISSSTLGSITWKGLDITNANVTQGSGGTASATGLALALGSLTTGGTQYGLNITGSSSNAAGTETGINISGITGGVGATETGLAIGAGWDQGLSITSGAGETAINVAVNAVPTTDVVNITNVGFGTTSTGVNDLQITYVGGAAAVEAAAQRIDLTGGTTAGGIWSGLRVVQGTITPGTTVQGVKLETAGLSSTSGTTVINGLSLPTAGAISNSTAGSIAWNGLNITNANVTQGASGSATATGLALALGSITTGGTQYGLNITGSSSNAAGTQVGINISNITPGSSSDTGLVIGTGWDEAIRANGTVTIGAQANTATTGTATVSLNSAAGTFGAATANDKVTASIVFRGKLFVAVAKTNAAGVYRYDGGTTWTLVTNAIGKAVAADATDADAFVMTVYNDKLYIGNQTATTTGALYSSSTADTTANSFTMVNATRGSFGMSQTAVTGITDMLVYNGQLIIADQIANAAEIGRYDGGTTFTQINATDGKSAAETTADKDGFILSVYNGYLYSGSITGSTTNIIAAWNGNGTTWINLTVAATGGTFGADTAYSDTNSMVVFDGNLYISMSKTAGNAAAVYMLKTTTAPVAAVPLNFIRVNTTVGKLVAADAADQDQIILATYNGRLYGASSTGSTTAAIYEYPQAGAGAQDWTLMNTTRGTFGADTAVDSVTSMVEFNGTMYVGTFKTGAGSVYTWTKTAENSNILRFDSGSSNYGAISFVGGSQALNNSQHFGTFNFSNSISLSSGAFDYAEDYPTFDSSLVPGEPVAVDPDSSGGEIKRASPGDVVIGVVSKTPGMRLSSADVPIDGAKWIPIALTGRVPVRVTSNNGANPIAAGDKLSLVTPGVLHKAQPGEDLVGAALGGYSGNGIGEVDLFVHPEWSAASAVSKDGSLGLKSNTADVSNLLSLIDQSGQSVAVIDNQGNATFKGTVTADKIKANQIEGLEIITDKITNLQSQITKTKALATKTATAASKTSGLASLTNGSNVNLGNIQAVNLLVMAQIETKGGLKVDQDAQFSGKTLFQLLAEFNGPVKFNGAVSFNSDAGGSAVIKKDAQKVDIKFSKEYPTSPVITANYLFIDNDSSADQAKLQRLLDGGYNFIVTKTSTKGFSILLNKPATEDINFSWLATQINNPQISQSQPAASTSGP